MVISPIILGPAVWVLESDGPGLVIPSDRCWSFHCRAQSMGRGLAREARRRAIHEGQNDYKQTRRYSNYSPPPPHFLPCWNFCYLVWLAGHGKKTDWSKASFSSVLFFWVFISFFPFVTISFVGLFLLSLQITPLLFISTALLSFIFLSLKKPIRITLTSSVHYVLLLLSLLYITQRRNGFSFLLRF